ncbi:MAG: RHS repeat domain-containing protein [Flavobacteriales bacterium]
MTQAQRLPIRITHLNASGNEKGIINQRYDGLGELRKLTDELGQVIRYEYYNLG